MQFSQILITFQPCSFSVRTTSLSRAMLRAILLDQYSRFFLGSRHFLGCPCQKQPSTKTATLARGNTKSGFPKRGYFLRQPTILSLRKMARRAASVDAFPLDFTWAIIQERFFELTMSIVSRCILLINAHSIGIIDFLARKHRGTVIWNFMQS